jgi:hypothetical protein
MKHLYLKIIIFLSVFGLFAFIPDHFLMPENFYLHKGDKFNLHLLSGENLIKEREVPYTAAQTTKFMIYEGSKKNGPEQGHQKRCVATIKLPHTG